MEHPLCARHCTSEQAVFPRLTVVLLAASKFFAAWFFVYRVTSTTDTQISTRSFSPLWWPCSLESSLESSSCCSGSASTYELPRVPSRGRTGSLLL
uniref:Uncharacterized protein n=1 Tax=Equus asinus TaxID=9793 RepID=A0A9L0IBR9_EQUAS